MSHLKLVVDLFRASNSPIFDGVRIVATVNYTSETNDIIKKMYCADFSGGTFHEVVIDGIEIYDVDELPESWGILHYSFNVARRSADRFYQTKYEFITINSLKKGVMPDQFYIVDDNYYSLDENKPNYIIKIEKICLLISYLSIIAHFHDIKSDQSVSFYRLVFVLHSESKSSTAVIETNLSEDMLDESDLNIDLIATLSKSDATRDNHYLEKLNTFRNTLIEFIANSNGTFSYIVKNWEEINLLYSNNLAVYMSAFSFHKTRKEVADAEIDYAEKISKVVTEITNKALAIPVSLVAAISVFQLSDIIITWIALGGVFLTSIVTALVASSQKRQLSHIIHAKNTLFSTMMNRLTSEQNDLKIKLDEAILGLRRNEIFCIRILDLISCLSWMPTCVGIIAMLLKI